MIAGLHVILDTANEARTLKLARLAEEEGAAAVQLRDKVASDEELVEMGKHLRHILKTTAFIVNDRVDVALKVDADGVHLGQGDMPIAQARELLGPNAIIGVSTGDVEQALEAERSGADYLGFGHMFPTRSKEKASLPRTTKELASVVVAVSIPVIAIGGISQQNLSDILVPCLGGIAVISAISESHDPRATIRNFVRTLEEHRAIYA